MLGYITAVVASPDPLADLFIFMATRKGKVKKMHLDKFQNIRRVGLAAFDLDPNDSLLTARLAEEGMNAVLIGPVREDELTEIFSRYS